MEMELEPRVKPLTYKIKAMSRETTSQKAINVLDTDLRSYWSTGTNTKEWILLELDEPCLLSHIRIHNKSVLEWEVAAGLRYKPETFVKVRLRCEAPRRDMIYSMNYTPCRYVRVSCLRGSPIAVFFIQLIGISVPGLEPEFQPVVNFLLPQISSHEQDSNGLHLQLLQDITERLHVYLPQLEADLTRHADEPETSTRFLAMLSGPFYPILHIISERDTTRCSAGVRDPDNTKNSQPSPSLTVSSNFESRRLRSMSAFSLPSTQSTVFCSDAIFLLLRKAFTDNHLGAVCKVASRILHYLAETSSAKEQLSLCTGGTSPLLEEVPGGNTRNYVALSDYSELFGEEFLIPVVDWDSGYTNVLDIAVVEEGILHVLYACASESSLCSKLASSMRDFRLALPLIQALLPALRPASSSLNVDDTLCQWKQPFVQQALSKIVSALSSTMFHPLLHGCAGYLSSFSPSHAKTASVLIDLCNSALAPWMPRVIAKIDLTMELLEDLLGIIQAEYHSMVRVRAALVYLVLALSGCVDEVLTEYKDAKLRVLFLLEMLESFLEPAISSSQNMMDSVEVSYSFLEDDKNICAIALNVIRAAVRKPSVLPSLEMQWRLGSIPPRVLLSILDPHLQLPPEIDRFKSSFSKLDKDTSNSCTLVHAVAGGNSKVSTSPGNLEQLVDVPGKADNEEASLFFAPEELRKVTLLSSFGKIGESNMRASCIDTNHKDETAPGEHLFLQISKGSMSDSGFSMKYFSLPVDHAHLLDYEDCESRASEFRRLGLSLHSQDNINLESHNAAIDAFILSAECYINPFMMSVNKDPRLTNQWNGHALRSTDKSEISELRKALGKGNCNLEMISKLERKRDKVFIQILVEAAEMDKSYYQNVSDGEQCPYGVEPDEEVANLSEYHAALADAITLVRRNQVLLCNFLINQLRREQKLLHETLMQSLLFLLHSATKLVCSPEDVIDIILSSGEHLNRCLISIFHQYKEGILHLSPEKVYRMQRHWEILQSLVVASCGVSGRFDDVFNVSSFRYNDLVPSSTWISKILTFSSCPFPLVRYLGWMAIYRIANAYLNKRLFLASNLSQLTQLLSIFADDLAVLECIRDSKKGGLNLEELSMKLDEKDNLSRQHFQDQSFSVMYPDLSIFFPNMSKEFKAFRECILEAVGLQLRSLEPTAIPDILCWFSDLCVSPFQQKFEKSRHGIPPVKGYYVKNAKAIILYVLEAIISEHMEAVVPEIPRLVQVLGSLCRSLYCDVSFLSSVIRLLKPIISYSLRKVSNEEIHLNADSCLTFESLCFDELFSYLRQEHENLVHPAQKVNRALVIFILASVFRDLSYERKREVLQLSAELVDFPTFQPTTTFHDYLCSFQQLLQSCNEFLVDNLRLCGLIPMPQSEDVDLFSLGKNGSKPCTWFPDDFCYVSPPIELDKSETDKNICSTVSSDVYHLSPEAIHLSPEAIQGYVGDIEGLIYKLSIAIELSWGLHPQLSKNLSVCSAQCLMYSKCLYSAKRKLSVEEASENDDSLLCKSFDDFLTHWKISMEGLVESVTLVLEKNCWEVASTTIDCLLRVPAFCSLDDVVSKLCISIEKIMYDAPKIPWRLQTDRWLSNLFSKGVLMRESGLCLVELVSKMLSHPEPEQRFTALMHLGRLLGLNVNGGWVVVDSSLFNKLASRDNVVSITESVLSHLVASTWDQLAFMASADASLHLRTLAKALLLHCIPFAEHAKLKSFLETADTLFQPFLNFACPMDEGLSAQLSLALIAGVGLYTIAEDISLVPNSVWRYIETLRTSKPGRVGEMEKRICQALCKARIEDGDAKQTLKEALSSCPLKEFDPDFGSTRESVLQVLANLTSVQSYFDAFAEKLDQEAAELEEAELEIDILQKEDSQKGDDREGNERQSNTTNECRLQQIKNEIQSLEKSRLREEIMVRRQKKLLMRRSRLKYLEDVTLRETELLDELDRQKTMEMEKEIERQRLLELERAKTSELRYNLELERERQTQREIQRELEQVESGSRPPRREFLSSSHSGRPRERYKERDNGRSGGDGNPRVTSTSLPPDIPVNTPSFTPTPTVLSGSRSFSTQLPTILHSRDRTDDCSSSYEENFDGSKDSGDTGSTGDAELGSGFDGLSGSFGGSQRHGSRGSKPRQAMERRERGDGRREGKWERKH